MAFTLKNLNVKLFTDGADKAQIRGDGQAAVDQGLHDQSVADESGAGVGLCRPMRRELVAAVPDRHISFEVFSDDIPEMVAQARVISDLGTRTST